MLKYFMKYNIVRLIKLCSIFIMSRFKFKKNDATFIWWFFINSNHKEN